MGLSVLGGELYAGRTHYVPRVRGRSAAGRRHSRPRRATTHAGGRLYSHRVTSLTLDVDVKRSAEEVDRQQWGAVAAGKSLYAQRSWFALNESSNVESFYLIGRGDAGEIRAILPAHFLPAARSAYYSPSRMFGDALPPVLADEAAWFPGMLGGARAGFLNEILVDGRLSPEDRPSVLRQLANGLDALNESYGGESVVFMYVPTLEAVSLLEAYDAAVPVFTAAETIVEVEWESFDGYLRALSKSRRHAVKREILRFEATSPRVTVGHLSDAVATAIAPLVANVYTKYGEPQTLPRVSANLQRQAEHLGEASVVFTCERDGRLIGCSFFCHCGTGLFARAVGFDYGLIDNRAEYFNLLFYRPIQYAIEHGLKRVHYGIDTYEAKLFRGAKPRPLWSVVHRRAWDVTEAEKRARVWNAARVAEFEARYGPLVLGGLEPAEWSAPPSRRTATRVRC